MGKIYVLANGDWNYLVVSVFQETPIGKDYMVWLTDDVNDETDGYSSVGDYLDTLEELADMLDVGIITKTEYDEIVEEIRGW